MKNRGQLTIFIIVGIVIIALVVLIFSLKTGIIKQPLNPDTEKVYDFVQGCIEEEGIKTIYTIGQNGGYFSSPEFSTDTGVPYYYSDGKNYMPSKEQVEKQIDLSIDEKLSLCIKDFVDFPDLRITQREIKTQTTISENNIILNVNYPISIVKGESTSLIEDFETEIPVRVGIVYDSIEKIIQEQLTHDESICLSCLLNVSLENNLYVDMFEHDNETTIFTFRDETSKINDETFVWTFANKYKLE
tara:strand:+ start:1400 stop:2134 length:735 start_codon:yes stop_codon:yes gene_type:complete